MAYDALAASTAAQAAQTQRAAAAQAAHNWFISQQAAGAGQPDLARRAEYMRRAAIIDAGYEVAVEPHRQAFLEQYPGVALPEFLQPSVRSFAGRLYALDAEENAGVRSGAVAGLSMKKKRWAGMSWAGRLGVVAGSTVVAFVALYALALLVLYVIVENDNSSGQAAPVRTQSSCEVAMKMAAQEPDSTKADPLISRTLQVCGSKSEWVAALKKYPAAMGMYEVTGTEWIAACIGEEDAPACRG